jgi:Cyclic nucleotide-binding domain
MAFEPDSAQLLSRLPTHLTTDLFAGANPVKLAADQVLFVAGDPGDSCYRVELGLLKVTMVSRSGIERILSFIGRGGTRPRATPGLVKPVQRHVFQSFAVSFSISLR